MGSATVIIVLLFAVVLSGIAAKTIPVPIPRPLIQIAFGCILGMFADLRLDLDPDLFFLLLVPPLLFLDGWRIPKEELIEHRSVILQLALGLVFLTVLGIGFLAHWMVPEMPLAVAFALAAVLSPTDPVAVSAISTRVPMPRSMLHILRGEALLNDASGLICLRFAIMATITGMFSPTQAVADFLWLALGGIAVGVGATWAINRAKRWAMQRAGEESGSQIIISLMMPFIAYVIAVKLNCSGILAAVAAGITMNFAEVSGNAMASTRIRRNSVWDAVQFAANGVVFVLLGEQFPAIAARASATVGLTGHQSVWWLMIYVIALYAAIMLIRFAWVWVSLSLNVGADARLAGTRRADIAVVATASLAGARGAITLAGVMTLPLALGDGTPFPARDLAIFLAMGVIMLSLVAASVGLPLLLKHQKVSTDLLDNAREDHARVVAAEAAIKEIERMQHKFAGQAPGADVNVAAAGVITELYRERIRSRSRSDGVGPHGADDDIVESQMRIGALRAERGAVYTMLRSNQIGSDTARKLVRELDLLEARYDT